MTFLRRLRGIVGTIATWGCVFAAVSLLVVGVLGLAGQLPSADFETIAVGLARLALRWGLIGAGIGTLFTGTIMLAERQQSLGSISSRRFGLWGFGAGAALPLAVTAASRLAGHSSINTDVRLAVIFALFCGTVGASVAIASLRLARRTGPTSVHDRAPVI